MESSTLFTIGKLRGVKTGSILNTVVEYRSDVKEGIQDYASEKTYVMEGEKREITLALETFYRVYMETIEE